MRDVFIQRLRRLAEGARAEMAIVEEHGGKLKVATEVGKGTSFTISLPLQSPVPAPPSPASIAATKRC